MFTALMNAIMCIVSLAHAVELLGSLRVDALQRVCKKYCKAFRLSVTLLRAWKLSLSHFPESLGLSWASQSCHSARSATVVHQMLKLGALSKINCEAFRLPRRLERKGRGSWLLIYLQIFKLIQSILELWQQQYTGFCSGSLRHHEDETL